MPSKLMEQIKQLSVDEQRALADEIYESLPDDLGLTPEQLDEAERRLAEHDAHPETSIPLEQVKAEIRAKYK